MLGEEGKGQGEKEKGKSAHKGDSGEINCKDGKMPLTKITQNTHIGSQIPSTLVQIRSLIQAEDNLERQGR